MKRNIGKTVENMDQDEWHRNEILKQLHSTKASIKEQFRSFLKETSMSFILLHLKGK